MKVITITLDSSDNCTEQFDKQLDSKLWELDNLMGYILQVPKDRAETLLKIKSKMDEIRKFSASYTVKAR